MQSTKLRSVYNLVAINRDIIRSVAVNASAVKESEDPAKLKPWTDIPGPPSLPLIGQLLNFLPGGMMYKVEGIKFSNFLYKKYGPILKLDGLFGRPTIIFLFDADGVAQILRGENWMPIRPGFHSLEYYRKKHNKTEEQSKPTGLITDHGDLWKEFRSTVNPVMLQPKTIKLYSNVLDEVALDMVARLRSIRDENNVIRGEFDVEMNLWALESIGSVALGCRLNCFDPNLAEGSPERQLIRCIHDFFKISEQLDFKPSPWKYIATPKFKRAMKLYEEQENLIKYFVNKGIDNIKSNKSVPKTDDEKGVLEKLLDINEDVAVIMASDMLFAGVDTASNTITATLYLLAKNPEKQIKLRDELNSDQQKKPYLKACIKEAMRILPVVTGNIRQTSKQYNILGYKLPIGTQVVFAHYDMAMMEEHYPKAKEYIPERWIADKSDPMNHGNAHPFAFAPFGFGVRSCIGRRIAELEVETFLTRMIQNFHVDWTGPPIKTVQTSLNYMKGTFHFTIKDV